MNLLNSIYPTHYMMFTPILLAMFRSLLLQYHDIFPPSCWIHTLKKLRCPQNHNHAFFLQTLHLFFQNNNPTIGGCIQTNSLNRNLPNKQLAMLKQNMPFHTRSDAPTSFLRNRMRKNRHNPQAQTQHTSPQKHLES